MREVFFMEEIERTLVKTSGFTSKSFNEGRRPGRTRAAFTPTAGNERRGGGHAYLLVRLGVCALLFCGILGLKLRGDERALAVIGEVTESGEEGQDADETLGRLKFVELPSIAEVFAPKKAAALPVNMLGFTLSSGGGLTLITVIGSEVVSPVDGTVSDLSGEGSLGGSVTVTMDDGTSFTVYGLSDIAVEKGQPVGKKQLIGRAKGSAVTVRAERDGVCIDVAEVFGLGGAV
jgi:murein DD-endopeptidase MepM/ murein hydrolase activator NlpD